MKFIIVNEDFLEEPSVDRMTALQMQEGSGILGSKLLVCLCDVLYFLSIFSLFELVERLILFNL